MKNKSPVIKKGPQTTDFYTALRAVMEDKKIRSQAWPAADYACLQAGFLHVFTRGEIHRWIVSDGDLTATDWVVL